MEETNIFSFMYLYDFIRGPLVWISFMVFILGTVFQTIRFIKMSNIKETIGLKPGPGRILPKTADSKKKSWAEHWIAVKLSIAGVNPFMTVVTTIFHVCLVIIPIFLLGHNILLDTSFGISIFSLSEKTTDILTQIFLICVLVFLYRRLFLARVKEITTPADFVFLFLAAAPFLTGYLAYHQTFDNYKVIITLHILFGNLMLMAIPFTKFVHMIYFAIVRFFVISEWNIGKGNRSW